MSLASAGLPPASPATTGPPPRACDVIVIGAGHNGLVAANYLADAGLDVVVLERRHAIGGMTRSDHPIAEAPQHLINHCAVDPIFWPGSVPAQELGLHEHGLRWVSVDPAFAYLHPSGESIAFWRDPHRTAEDIRRFSRADAAAYLELAALFEATCDVMLPMFATNPTRPDPAALTAALKGALRHRGLLTGMGRFLVASGRDEISERFEHPVVRSALHVASGCLYPSSYPGSTIQMLILAFVHRFECLRPVGGTQSIPNALAARLTARSGRIVTGAQAVQILTAGGRASGVVLADGSEIQARRAVLGSCDPQQTLTELLPAGTLEPRAERRARAMPANDLGWGQLKVDVACSGQVDLSRFDADRTDGADLRAASHLIGTEDGLERGYRRAAAGLLPHVQDIGFYNAIPNAVDATQTPDGQDAVYLINVTTPANPEGGWTPQLREQAIGDTLARAALFYGDLLELELGRSAFTNADMAAEIGAESQSHVAWTLNRMGPLRPAVGFAGFSTPVPGLYLGGAGSHPGAAVTGTPGYLGAREILRDLRRGEAGGLIARARARA
ncbi:MAG: NAD(P)/FAD-dependent oxidoreductase, partial [Solirubrobacterales bacterium]|nr:NAD(P)/FAD-dependent oxidoreductase [Solirubrobacterales bacterium]